MKAIRKRDGKIFISYRRGDARGPRGDSVTAWAPTSARIECFETSRTSTAARTSVMC